MKITEAELKIVLKKHTLWLINDPNGVRANLSGADLSRANLNWADLSRANLSRANLSGANLSRANLSGADLSSANLNWANLSMANLSMADLSMADLNWADLSGANLSMANLSMADLSMADLNWADLSGAKNVNVPLTCPEKGSFIGFKKVRGNYIVELEILADAMRSSAAGRKCRCSKAKVVSITNPDGSNAEETSARSGWDLNFIYSVGEIVEVKDFDTNRWNECAPGIHFFITRQEAIDYVL